MNIVVTTPLPALINSAAQRLAKSTTAAEILEAREIASHIYDSAKKAARLAKAKGAHDTVIAAAHRAQADALEIEAGAKRRLADEYDAAQERGEVASQGKPSRAEGLATTADIGLTHKDIHESRKLRDAEARDPGITRRTLDKELREGREPTKAALRRALIDDESDDDDIEEDLAKFMPTTQEMRADFFIAANMARDLARYNGPIDAEIIEAARITSIAWSDFVALLSKSGV